MNFTPLGFMLDLGVVVALGAMIHHPSGHAEVAKHGPISISPDSAVAAVGQQH